MSLKRARFVVCRSITGLAVAVALGAAAYADDFVSYRIPFSGMMVDTCNGGEKVALNGEIHGAGRTFTDEAGNLHVLAVSAFNDVTGVGATSGLFYHATGGQEINVNQAAPADQGAPFEFTQIAEVNLITQGALPNLRVHLTFKYTLVVIGGVPVMTANVLDYTAVCEGAPAN